MMIKEKTLIRLFGIVIYIIFMLLVNHFVAHSNNIGAALTTLFMIVFGIWYLNKMMDWEEKRIDEKMNRLRKGGK